MSATDLVIHVLGKLMRALSSGLFAAAYATHHRPWQLAAAVVMGLLTLVDLTSP